LFPLKNLAPTKGIPFITYLLIVLNVATFFYLKVESPTGLYLLDFGLVPNKLGMPFVIIPIYEMIYPFFTYMFLHGGYFHLFFNIYFLYIFGAVIESRLGHIRYMLVFIFFGVVAGITQVISDIFSGVPIVGASGAIAGLMGAYLVFYPKEKIKTLFIIVIFIMIRDIPAMIFIIAWFLIQVIYLYISLDINSSGIAFYAHIGGFVIGVVVALVIKICESFNKTEKEIRSQLIGD